MIPRTAAVFMLAAFALGGSLARAQQPEGPAMPTVPPSTCVKPEFPGPFPDQRRFDRFNKEYKAYADCTKKYVADTKAVSDAYFEAGNKAVKEFNAFNEELAALQAAKK
jgi:hypothetical protein